MKDPVPIASAQQYHIYIIEIFINIYVLYSGMRLGFGKNSGKFYVAIDSNPNNTVCSSYLR